MAGEVTPLTDEEICEKAAEFAREIASLQGKGQGADRNQKRREWVFFLKGLSRNARRTVARNAYWAEYDRISSGG